MHLDQIDLGNAELKQNESGYSICGISYGNTDEHCGSPLHRKLLNSFTKKIALLTLEHASGRCSNIQIVNCLGKRWNSCVLVGQQGGWDCVFPFSRIVMGLIIDRGPLLSENTQEAHFLQNR